jgi:hypothetical protein
LVKGASEQLFDLLSRCLMAGWQMPAPMAAFFFDILLPFQHRQRQRLEPGQMTVM